MTTYENLVKDYIPCDCCGKKIYNGERIILSRKNKSIYCERCFLENYEINQNAV